MTAMRSDRISASSWSWVTKMVVSPSRAAGGASRAACLAQLAVERAERLVEQQQPRVEDDGAGQRHALLLAARELARQALARSPSSSTRRERLGDAPVDLAPWRRCASRAGRRRCRHREMREQRVVLEHHADVAPGRRQGGDLRARRPSPMPPSGVSKPATTFSSVVLPEPLGPRMVRTRLAPPASETPSSATTSPKRLPTPSIRRSADRSCCSLATAHAFFSIQAFHSSAALVPFSAYHSSSIQNCLSRYWRRQVAASPWRRRSSAIRG